jgi:peptide/nickel transport system ATP-binding protein
MTVEQISSRAREVDTDVPVLSVRGLTTRFHTERGVVRAVSDVGFDLAPGETLGIVGESGSGKSVTAMSLLRMVRSPGRVEGGSIRYHGRDLLALSEAEMREVRGGGIGMVFQDPMSSLNPVMRIRDQLVEAMLTHGKFTGAQAAARAVELMARVGIPDPEARLADYPHAFSGGMRQRVMIAMALANQPDVIIADEPTTALDVTVQAQILDLLAELNRDLGTAIVLITHNLGVVARVCDRVAVMYGGRIVEQAGAADLFAAPRHPYTRALLRATPRLAGSRHLPLTPIHGRPPDLLGDDRGCAFAPRCGLADDHCATENPFTAREGDRSWACWRSAETGVLPVEPVSGAAPVRSAVPADDVLLRVENLSLSFPVVRRDGWLRKKHDAVHAVDGVSLTIAPGETLGLVGESGCGKSSLGKALLGIHRAQGGTISFAGRDVTAMRPADRAWFRRNVQLVFQDPMSSLNPRLTIGQALREPLEIHRLSTDPDRRVAELLDLVGLDPAVADRYPHEFSGGQRQRVVIARALAVEPKLLVCDEAVSALDVSLQAQIVNLLQELQQELGLAYLFIGHDLATVRHISHRIAVMYLGRIVETGPSEQVTSRPAHPYTMSLLSAAPEPDPAAERARERISSGVQLPHAVPDRAEVPSGKDGVRHRTARADRQLGGVPLRG